MNKALNLIFTIDEKYIQHFTVTLISIIENNRDIKLTVFVIHDINNFTFLSKVLDFFKAKYNLSISLLSIDNSLFEHYTITYHVSKATYFRLMMADLIPEHIDHAVFLDSDIVVNGSLGAFADLEFKDNYLFAVTEDEIYLDNVIRLNKLGIPAEKYFNAGVMVLNLKAWRAHNVSKELISIAKKYAKELLWWDQDVLNMFFYDKWEKLPSKYNEKNIINTLAETPVIVHYTGSIKPWNYLSNHPYKKLYWFYLKLSPFKNYRYEDLTLKSFVKKMIFFNKV